MKKFGFTLAEILVALGIIGVIAAMTMPTFTSSTAEAKIGPALATAVSNFEQANAAMLQANGVEKISKAVAAKRGISSIHTISPDDYCNKLSDYLKFSNTTGGIIGNEATILTKNGVSYKVSFFPAEVLNKQNANIGANPVPHKILMGGVTIDINGPNAKPNQDGVDKFYFGMFEDGSLRPKGGHQSWNNTDDKYWDTECATGAEPVDASYCAGSIFENNLKVMYE